MNKNDERELYRLTGLLKNLAERTTLDPATEEALVKAAFALTVAFAHGLQSKVEEFYENRDRPLSNSEREQLRLLGIDPGD